MPSGSRTILGESTPFTAAVASAATVVTPIAGSEATSDATGKASRGHGVSLTRGMLETSDAVPIVSDAWTNDQTVSPTRAKTT